MEDPRKLAKLKPITENHGNGCTVWSKSDAFCLGTVVFYRGDDVGKLSHHGSNSRLRFVRSTSAPWIPCGSFGAVTFSLSVDMV